MQKSLELCPDIPFICVSGTIGEEAAVELIRQGAVDYVIKDRLGRLPSAIRRAWVESKERKALRDAENALRLSEEKYRGIFENIQDVYFEANIDGAILEISPSIENLSKRQYRRSDLIGKSMDSFFVEKDDCKKLFAVLKDKNHVADYEIKLKNRDGSIVYCSIISKLTSNEKGQEIIIGSMRDITDRRQAEEQIKKNLDEKEILLRELYHRTKNNMQVILSMLELKALRSKSKELQFHFREIENKIQSMSLVHKKLYESEDLSTLNLKTYFEDLLALIKQNYMMQENHIRLIYEATDAPVLIDTAVPLGLVLNELLANVVKHAFPDKREGEVHITVNQHPQRGLLIVVKDNGVGLPEGFNIKKDCNLGLETTINLVRYQLGGRITFIRKQGLTCRIILEKEMYTPRI